MAPWTGNEESRLRADGYAGTNFEGADRVRQAQDQQPQRHSPPPPFSHIQQESIPENDIYHGQPLTPEAAYLQVDRGDDMTRHILSGARTPQSPDFSNDAASDHSDYQLHETVSQSSLHGYSIPLTGQTINFSRQNSIPKSRPYYPLQEMSEVYLRDDFHERIHPEAPPPQHNFDDPNEQYYYDSNKYNHPSLQKMDPRQAARLSRSSISSVATGVIDSEDAYDGDPDVVPPVDDDWPHTSIHPLDHTITGGSSRQVSRSPNANSNMRRNGNRRYNTELQRRLGARHLQMIALGGTVGVGLFLASAKALSVAGPLGAFLGYACMGFVVLCVMLSLGEMTALIPIPGGITAYAGRFVDDALGFAAGWMYWLSFALALPTEITAASILIRYYAPLENEKLLGMWITVFLGVVIATNSFNVRVYGEIEYCFGLLKVVTILSLIILMVVINAGGNSTNEVVAFSNWQPPNGPFRQHLVPPLNEVYKSQFFNYPNITGSTANFLSTWGSFTIAAFSFIGTEIVAVAAGEATNSRYALPSAVRRLFWRIAIFYVLGIFAVGLNVQSTSPQLLQFHDSTTREPSLSDVANSKVHGALGAHSPWVIAVTSAGIPVLPGLINGIFVFCAWSAGNSHLYASSRTLYGLAIEGKAPRVFRICSKSGVPVVSVLASATIALLAYIQCAGTAGQQVFDYLLRTTTVAGLIVWGTFCLAFIRFYYGLQQVRHIDRDSETYPYRSPFQPYLACIGLLMTTLTVIFNGFDYFLTGQHDPRTGAPIPRDVGFGENFLTAYLSLFLFIALFIFWKVYKKTTIQPLNRLNLDTGMAYGMDERRREPLSKGRKIVRMAVRTIG